MKGIEAFTRKKVLDGLEESIDLAANDSLPKTNISCREYMAPANKGICSLGTGDALGSYGYGVAAWRNELMSSPAGYGIGRL